MEEEIKKIRNSLFFYALKLTKDKEEAKDLLQSTMELIWRNRAKYDRERNLLSWSSVLMYNYFVDQKRKEKRRQANLDKYDPRQDKYFLPTQVRNKGLDRLEYNDVFFLIKQLKWEKQETFIMYFRGYKMKEIAEERGEKESTINARIFKTKKELQEQL